MMKKQSVLLVLLALSILLSVFAGCGAENETSSSEQTTAAENEQQTIKEDDPENPNLAPIDGGGEAFNVFCRKGGDSYLYKYSEVQDTEEYGMAVNDAVVERNYLIEEKYHIIITTTLTDYSFVPELEKDAAGGLKSFDIVMPMVESGFFAACKGLLTEWDLIPFVDETKSYWMTNIFENTSVGDYQFMCPGALNLSAYNTTQVMFFNKAMHKDLSLPNIYNLVKEKKWTQETMYGMAKQATNDKNGDGMDSEDVYGVVSGSVCWQSFYYASGKTLITKNDNDIPVLTGLTEQSSTTYDMITYIVENMNNPLQAGISSSIGWPGAVPDRFMQRQCLFFVEGIYGQYRILDMKDDYGIVPMALWEEGADYYSYIHATHSSVSAIPSNVKNLTLSGSVLEDLAYYSQQIVIPVYYEDVIHMRNIRDAESYEMLDIIFENIIIDLAQVMKSSGLTIDNDIRSFLDENKTDTIFSTISNNKALYENVVNQLAIAFTTEGAKQYAN